MRGTFSGLAALLLLAGCGESPDVDSMKNGLTKSGMPTKQAVCFSQAMSKTLDGKIYNNLATLLNQGETEKNAVNKTRRKFGAEFKVPLEKARKGCVKEKK